MCPCVLSDILTILKMLLGAPPQSGPLICDVIFASHLSSPACVRACPLSAAGQVQLIPCRCLCMCRLCGTSGPCRSGARSAHAQTPPGRSSARSAHAPSDSVDKSGTQFAHA